MPNYQRKPTTVAAEQYEPEARFPFAGQLGIRYQTYADSSNLMLYTTHGWEVVRPTDWVVREGPVLLVLTDQEFQTQFTKAEN